MKQTIVLRTEQDTIDLAAYIAPLLAPGDILCLSGDLGSGKTFFTKALGRNLHITEEIDSPSFVLLKEYYSGKYPFYHLDLYRLKHEEELLDLGILDMIDSGITVIEWPELAKNILPYQGFDLDFKFDGTHREVTITPPARVEDSFAPLNEPRT